MSQSPPPFQTKSAAASPRPTASASTAAPPPPPVTTTTAEISAAPVAPPLAAPTGPSPHLDSIMRIPVVVQVFLGAASMPIADLMKLGRGAIVALDHDIGDPVDVVVNGRVIARGELVALEEDPSKIGVKLTEIVGSPDTAA